MIVRLRSSTRGLNPLKQVKSFGPDPYFKDDLIQRGLNPLKQVKSFGPLICPFSAAMTAGLNPLKQVKSFGRGIEGYGWMDPHHVLIP